VDNLAQGLKLLHVDFGLSVVAHDHYLTWGRFGSSQFLMKQEKITSKIKIVQKHVNFQSPSPPLKGSLQRSIALLLPTASLLLAAADGRIVEMERQTSKISELG
jgi:hypothetical protein